MKTITVFSNFIGRTSAIWMIVFVVLGLLLLQAFNILLPWIVVLRGFSMFGVGLTISVKDFSVVSRRPFDVAIGVLL